MRQASALATDRFTLDVDGCLRTTDERAVDAVMIVAMLGSVGASTRQVLRVLPDRTVMMSRSDEIELNEQEVAFFRTFPNGPIYRFLLDGCPFEWGSASISVDDLRAVANVGPDMEMAIVDGGGLGEDDRLSLWSVPELERRRRDGRIGDPVGRRSTPDLASRMT